MAGVPGRVGDRRRRSGTGKQRAKSNARQLTQHIANYICQQGGKVEFPQLMRELEYSTEDIYDEESVNNLRTLIEHFPQLFRITTGPSAVRGCAGGMGHKMVEIYTGLKLCEEHFTKDGCRQGGRCDALHICKFFILGSCRFSDVKCLYGHNLYLSQNNQRLLRDHMLDLLNVDQIKMVLNPAKRSKVNSTDIFHIYVQ